MCTCTVVLVSGMLFCASIKCVLNNCMLVNAFFFITKCMCFGWLNVDVKFVYFKPLC